MKEPFDAIATIRSKNPSLTKKIPRFCYPWIRRILCQDQVNQLFEDSEGRQGLDLVKWMLEYLDIKVSVKNQVNLDLIERVVFCANHPTGGIDGIVLMAVLGERYSDLAIPVNNVLIALPGLDNYYFPLDKYSKKHERLRRLDALYKSDKAVAIFPAGKTARLEKGQVVDQSWTKSFLRKAKLHDRSLVPIHLSGKNSRRFYRIWKWRTRFKIGVNFEMFLLIDELFKLRGTEVLVTIGEQVDAKTLPANDQDAVEKIKALTENLGKREVVYGSPN